MTSNSVKKLLGLDLLSSLNELLKNAPERSAAENSICTPDSANISLSNSSAISLASRTSNTPPIETLEDSLPPSPSYGLPVNFGEVAPGIYRSSFPQGTNFEHLSDLKLKTILTLVSEQYSNDYLDFINSQGICHYQIMIPPNKEAFAAIPLESMTKALSLISDTQNHPILVHCNKGKHRTGCVIGCYRKMCDWGMDKVVAEYRNYAGAKARSLDEKYIAAFDQQGMIEHLNGVAYHKAKEKIPLLTPPASER